jgi:predicted transcriptional regulator
MPSELLKLFNEGKTYSLQELSDRLQMDIPVIQAELEFLQRLGYVRKVTATGCGKKCHSCSGCGESMPLPVVWEREALDM